MWRAPCSDEMTLVAPRGALAGARRRHCPDDQRLFDIHVSVLASGSAGATRGGPALHPRRASHWGRRRTTDEPEPMPSPQLSPQSSLPTAKAVADELPPMMPVRFFRRRLTALARFTTLVRFTVLSDKTLLFLADFDG